VLRNVATRVIQCKPFPSKYTMRLVTCRRDARYIVTWEATFDAKQQVVARWEVVGSHRRNPTGTQPTFARQTNRR
jgi:hypothetical protein